MDDRVRNGRTIGSVKAAINMYDGGRINQVIKKPTNDASNYQIKTSKAPELHLAKNGISQINENRAIAESEKSHAEFELQKVKKLVRELNLRIEESNSRAKEFKKGAKVVNHPAKEDNDQYKELAREIEVVKRKIRKIKLEIENAAEEKFQAEKEADVAGSRLEYYMKTAERLRMEIEEANKEEVLFELAQMQARKEIAEIEAERKKEEEKHSLMIEEMRKKISIIRDEVEKMKDAEVMLEATRSDVAVLQNELNLMKEMDSRLQKSQKMKKNSGFQSVMKDLEAAKKELESIKEEGIELMSSMDVIRYKLINIAADKSNLEKREAEKEKYMKKLNSKVLRAKDKLQVSTASEEKAKGMLQSFLLTLESLEKEKEAARKEEEKVKEETAMIRNEIQKIESDMDVEEENLQAVVEELNVVKSAEANALEKLQAVAENAAKERAIKTNSTITIPRFEYEYLKGCATEAQELADKKVAAANAWTKALMADEKEMKMKTAVTKSIIEELKLKEAEAVHVREEAENEAELGLEELQRRPRKGRVLFRYKTYEHFNFF
ncbi:Protein PLASTID MOVEMENT IMPAIRED 2 [Bienertia sinuspersici]